MSPIEARVLCLMEAARLVDLYGPGVEVLELLADEDGPVVWSEARRLAGELKAHATGLEREPVQLELFAEVRR